MNETPALLLGFGAQLAAGTLVTAGLAVASLVGGLLLGIAGAAARMSRRRPLRAAVQAYTTAVRGVPELLVVLIVYFGASAAIGRVAALFGFTGFFELNPFLAGVTALSLTFGAYATEVLRGAFLAVPRGQVEAACALGLTRMGRFATCCCRRCGAPRFRAWATCSWCCSRTPPWCPWWGWTN